jgi:hypothetical protein
MLDHDHGVAEVAQVNQRFQQAGIVALVQADGGLVQHVEHAGQARADLRGKPDALAFAARQRAGIARQRQVVEPDIVEELQPLADFLEDAAAIWFCWSLSWSGSSSNQSPHCGSTFGNLRRCAGH